MKTKITLLTLAVFLTACSNESQISVAAETIATVEQDTIKQKSNNQKIEAVAETTMTTPVTIKEMFLLLPDDALPMEGISVANRKLLLGHIGEEKAYDISPTPIDVYDVKNGYLSLGGMQYGWEVSYWNMKDGRKLVATNNDTESGSEIRTFFYQDGNLTEDQHYQLGGKQDYKLTDFIDIKQLPLDIRQYAERQFNKGAYNLYYQLPQKGTSLTVNIDTYQLMLDYETDNEDRFEIPYEAIREVILKWENEQWVR